MSTIRQQCRACLEEVKSYKFFSDVYSEDMDILAAFCFCTSLQFDDTEASEIRNQSICNSCLNSLKFAFEFVKKARESDSQLRIIEYDDGLKYQLPLETEEVEDDDCAEAEVEEEHILIESTYQQDELVGNDTIEELEPETQELDIENEIEYTLETLDDDNDFGIENVPEDVFMEEEKESVTEIKNEEELVKSQQNTKKSFEIAQKGNHICKECSKSFMYNFQLQHHIKVNHLPEEEAKTFLCPQCPKKFYTRRHLGKHENTVHKEGREFKCDICEKEFQYKERLYRHRKTHLDRKHECPQCDKTYVQNADLVIHLRTHTNERPFQCDQCPEAFLNKSRLTNHIKRIHLDVKYKCRYCNKYEVRSHSTLRRHEQEHLKSPYQCPKCHKEFSRRKYFKDHMFNFHDNYVMPEAELDAMFIKNKNEIRRMEAVLGKALFANEIVEEEVVDD